MDKAALSEGLPGLARAVQGAVGPLLVVDVHNGDLNAFLKADNLGTDNHSPLLTTALAIQNAAFGMAGGTARIASNEKRVDTLIRIWRALW